MVTVELAMLWWRLAGVVAVGRMQQPLDLQYQWYWLCSLPFDLLLYYRFLIKFYFNLILLSVAIFNQIIYL